MDDPVQMSRLVSALSGDARYATGARRFPGHVSDDDAVAIAEALAAEFDRGTAQRAALAAQANLHIFCKSGCNDCCEILVMVYRPEALVIARWLQQPDHQATRAAFLAAYPAWRAAVGDTPEQLTALFAQGQGQAFDALHMAHWRKRILCAFNHDGKCSIYAVRPLACRNAHALDTNERCRADAPPAAAVEFVPLQRLLQSATKLLRATHNATSPNQQRHHQESICTAVHRLLTA